MKHLITVITVAISCSLLISCGTGKKLTAANGQIEQLNSQVSTLNSKIAENDKTINDLKVENTKFSQEAEECNKTKAAIAEKYDKLNKDVEAHGTSLEKIKQTADDAAKEFEHLGATVTYKHGLFHINFENKNFFKSGSTKIGTQGRETLNLVAKVMRENPGVTAYIVGNADTMSVKGKADNWTLSAERASAVARILRDEYAIDPARLTAAGRSKYDPVASNATPEGRERNRRVEIILNPNVPELWEMP